MVNGVFEDCGLRGCAEGRVVGDARRSQFGSKVEFFQSEYAYIFLESYAGYC